MSTPTHPLKELEIQITGAVALFDMEADAEHPDPIDDGIELAREAAQTVSRHLEEATLLAGSVVTVFSPLDELTPTALTMDRIRFQATNLLRSCGIDPHNPFAR